MLDNDHAAWKKLRTGAIPTDAAQTLEQLLRVRVSSRAFKSDPIPKATIRKILEMAQLTPSWCNSQSWQLEVVSGHGTERLRKVLYEAASNNVEEETDIPFPREYRGVHLKRRRESGLQLYAALNISRDDRKKRSEQVLENFRFFGAPHVLLIHVDEALGPYGAVDCGAYVSNFVLAAAALGVGTIPQAALAVYPKLLRKELGLGDDRTIVCGISFGFPDLSHPSNSYRTTRAGVDEVTHWIDE